MMFQYRSGTIFELRDLIPSHDITTKNSAGIQVRAMHEPFYDGLLARLDCAIAVLKGAAVAVRWPRDGEFEQAIALSEKP